MFDYMLRILPNQRILVRDNKTKEGKVLKPSEIAAFFEDKLEEQLKAEQKLSDQVAGIKKKLEEKE